MQHFRSSTFSYKHIYVEAQFYHGGIKYNDDKVMKVSPEEGGGGYTRLNFVNSAAQIRQM